MTTVAAPAPRRSRRWWPWILLGLFVALVPVALFAWDSYKLLASADTLKSSAAGAQQAVTDRDAEALSGQVGALQKSADQFATHSEGWHWTVASRVPWIRDQTVPVQQVGTSVRAIADGALAPLASMGDLTALESPPIQHGRIDPFFLEDVREPLAQAANVLEAESEALATVDMSGTLEEIALPYERMEEDIAEMADLVYSAHVAAELLPTMLGGEDVRTYALMVQNNAEPRTSGGIPGAVLELSVDDGRVELGRYLSGASMNNGEAVTSLTQDEERIFTDKMATYAQNVNLTPEYPRAAEVMAAFWKRATNEDIDGVLSIDPVAMGYLLDGMEPVAVDGVQVTSGNLAEVLLSEVYWRYPDPRESDAFFTLVARELFGQLLGGTTDVMGGVETSIDEGRFRVWSAHESEQIFLGKVPLGGQRVADGAAGGVYLNDASGSKVGYYVDQQIHITEHECSDGVVTGDEVAITLTHTYNGDVADLPPHVSGGGVYVPEGQYAANVLFYAPAGASLVNVTADGEPTLYSPDSHDNRTMAQVRISLEPGESRTLTFSTARGAAQKESVEWAWTPLSRQAIVTVDKNFRPNGDEYC